MKNMMINEQDLFSAFEHDSKDKATNTSVKSRLLYYFRIKSTTYKVRQNSFAEMFNWLFSFKNLTVKATLASLVIAFSLINFQGNVPSSGQFTIDTLSNKSEAFIDSSAMILPLNNDTSYFKL